MNTRGTLAAALSVVALTTAHLGGGLRFLDDIGRFLHLLPSAAQELKTLAREGVENRDTICSAISYVKFAADPSFEAFFDTINQTPRAKAERIYEAARDVYEDGEIYKASSTSAASSKGARPL